MPTKVKKPIKKTKSKKKKECSILNNKALKIAVLIIFLIILLPVVSFMLYSKGSDWLKEQRLGDEGDRAIEKALEVVVRSEESVVIDVVENSMDAVVSIAISKLEFTRSEGIVDTVNNIGSGFIVDPSGVIITNQHVVSDSSADYKVITNDGDEYEVIKILQDDVNDIALLKIEAEDLATLSLGDSDNLKPGQLVIAIGTPLGEYAGSVTTGVVSGLNRSVTARSQGFWGIAKTYEDVIQTDAAVNPGNSGGPLLNSSGEVIGINFATTSVAENISFALPSNFVERRLDEYRKYGKFLKPYLGIEYQMISESQARFYDDIVAGVLIMRVIPDSPASKAGLKRLDIITEVEGEAISESFANIIQQYSIGEEMKLTVWRDGQEIELVAILGEMDE